MSKSAAPALLEQAVTVALRAPSVHNTQPWRWRITEQTVELHADWQRHLVATDPDRRDLLISCGAALHHLQVALAGLGKAVWVQRLPDKENSGHLATVGIAAGPPDSVDVVLARSVPRRRTDRRRFSSRPVAAPDLDLLARRAQASGGILHPLTDQRTRQRLTDALQDAARRQQHAPGYQAELALWTQRYAGSRDGIPIGAIPPPPTGWREPAPLRRFPHGGLTEHHHPPGAHDAATLLLLCTTEDDPLHQLRAGESTSAVLLTATDLGMACTPLSQALEVPETRQQLGQQVLGTTAHPQLIIRVGWRPHASPDLPTTPRRPLPNVLIPG